MIDNVVINEELETGAKGGPMFQTSVIPFSSGINQRNQCWSEEKISYECQYGASDKTGYREIVDFCRKRRGQARGFLLHDFQDDEGVDEVMYGDADGTNKVFLFQKAYADSETTYYRRITRPRNATVVVKVDSVISSDYTIGASGGWIEFGTAPGAAAVVTASYTFDVPVRFTEDSVYAILFWSGAGTIDTFHLEGVRDTENNLDTACTLTLTNKVTEVHNDTSTASAVRVADITYFDPFPTADLYVGGADAAYFQITGSSLYLRAGTVLNDAVKASYAVSVNLRDPNIAADPAATDSMTLAVNTNSSLSVSVALTVLISGEPNGTSSASAIHVADCVVTGGHSGSNSLSLSGADAASFHLTGTQLFLNAGVDGGTLTAPPASYTVRVTVTDTTNANTGFVDYTLQVGTGVTPGTTDLTADGTYIVPNYNFLDLEFDGGGAGAGGTNRQGDDGGDTSILTPLFVTAGGGKAPTLLTTVGVGATAIVFNSKGGDGGTATGGDTNTRGKDGANGAREVFLTVTTALDRVGGDGAAGIDYTLGGAGAVATIPVFDRDLAPADGSYLGYPVYADGADGDELGDAGGGSVTGRVIIVGSVIVGTGFAMEVLARPGGGGGAKMLKRYVAGALGSPAPGVHLNVFVGPGGVGGGDYANGGDGFRGRARFIVS